MRTLTIILLVMVVVASAVISILKKYAMNQIGEISISKINLELIIKFATNPWALMTLFAGFGVWGLSMWLFSMEKASIAILLLHGAAIVSVLLALSLSHLIFGDVLTQQQYLGLILIIIASVMSTVGIYYIGNGGAV